MLVLKSLSILFIISSVMSHWIINFGITVQTYYVFGLSFSFLYTPFFLNGKKVLNKSLSKFFSFLGMLIFLKIFSYLGLLVFFSNNSIDFGLMADQYLKSIITNILNFVILISLAHFLFSQSKRNRKKSEIWGNR